MECARTCVRSELSPGVCSQVIGKQVAVEFVGIRAVIAAEPPTENVHLPLRRPQDCLGNPAGYFVREPISKKRVKGTSGLPRLL